MQRFIRQVLADHLPHLDQPLQIDAGTEPSRFEHEHQILSHDVPSRFGRERTAAHARERCIKGPDARFKRRIRICQAQPAGIVKVRRNREFLAQAAAESRKHPLYLDWIRIANGIGEGDLSGPVLRIFFGKPYYFVLRDCAFDGASKGCRNDSFDWNFVPSWVGISKLDDAPEVLERLIYGFAHVRLVVALGSRERKPDLVNPSRERPLRTLKIRD